MATIKQMLDICGNLEVAEETAKKYIKLDPSFYMDLYLIYSTLGKFEEAEKILHKVVDDPIRSFYNKGYLEMMKGRMLDGFYLMNYGRMEGFWKCPFQPTDRMTLWRGNDLQPIKGKDILFICEAGLGDQLIFIRFAKNLIELGANVIVACESSLVDVIKRIDKFKEVIPLTQEAMEKVRYDYWIPSMYSPVALNLQFEDLNDKPYLKTDNSYVEKFKNIVKNNSNKLKVGIRWLGRDGDDYITRVFPEKLMFDAVKQDHLDVYSLQKDYNKEIPNYITDLDEQLKCWDDTFAAISQMDLVISSCTSVAHAAAALGKPTWVVIPILPYYLWAWSRDKDNITTPWYESVTLYRQTKYGKWNDLFKNIKNNLNKIRT